MKLEKSIARRQKMPNETFNRLFNEVIPEGAEGNQAYFGLYYRDRVGRYNRITQAEGNEVAYNPETQQRNLIANLAPSDSIRRYQIQFSKNLLIRKGDPEYEFFNRFREKLPTGTNAQLQMMLVDFMQEAPGENGRWNYKAFALTVTCTIGTANNTDGILDISFGQTSDVVHGIASSKNFDDVNQYPEFIPSTKIPIALMRVSNDSVTLEAGGEAWIAVDVEPMGCPDGFEIVRTGADRYDENICSTRIHLDSVVITARKAGTTTVKVRSTADSTKYRTITVTVKGDTPPAGSPFNPEATPPKGNAKPTE